MFFKANRLSYRQAGTARTECILAILFAIANLVAAAAAAAAARSILSNAGLHWKKKNLLSKALLAGNSAARREKRFCRLLKWRTNRKVAVRSAGGLEASAQHNAK